MKNMKSAQEFIQTAPPGRYPSICISAEATLTKKGNPQLALIWEIAEGPHTGDQAYDYIGTDGSAKGAGIYSKPKLRALGIDVETDNEIPDAVLAQQIQGMRCMVDYDNQPRMSKSRPDDPSCPYDLPVTFPDPKTGAALVVQNLTVKGYSRVAGAAQHAQQPVQQYQQPAAPQFAAPPAQQFAQPPFQPAAPVFAQAPVQQAAAPAAGAPPGWVQAPDGSWQQVGQQAAPQAQATVPWAAQPNGTPAPAQGGGRKRKLVATDAPGTAEN